MNATHRTDWLHEAKWGVFLHFLAAPASSSGGKELSSEEWSHVVDGFDVAGLVGQLERLDAGYLAISIGQNSGHFCSPNATYDSIARIQPSKCSRRDLIMELGDALTASGIRLIVYIPSGAPEFEPKAVEAFHFSKGGRCAEFQEKWQAVMSEWSTRWGTRVSGWWLDGCYYNDAMYRHDEEPNFRSFARAIRSGNAEALIAWNPGVVYPPQHVDAEEDFTAGEINEPQEIDPPGRWLEGAQFHVLSYLGKSWGSAPLRLAAAEAVAHTLAVTRPGGAFTWDVPWAPGGLIAPDAFQVLAEVGRAVNPTRGQPDQAPNLVVRPTVKFTRVPSTDSPIGTFTLTLQNPWKQPLRGEVRLAFDPPDGAALEAPAGIGFDIEASANEMHNVSFRIHRAGTCLTIRRDGDPRELRYYVPSRKELILHRMYGNVALPQLVAKLVELPARPVVTSLGQHVADIRLAICGDHLAIAAQVSDAILRQSPAFWDASCIELFWTSHPGEPLHQLFLVPGTAHAPARALRITSSGSEPAEHVGWATSLTNRGYEAAALVPIERTEGFFIEIVLTAGIDPERFVRTPLFGSTHPAQSSDCYAKAIAAC